MSFDPPDPDRLARVLAPLGELTRLDLLEGGTFASVWEAGFASGAEAIVKIAPADDAPSLLLYEERMLRTEAWAMGLAAERGWPYPRLLLLDTGRDALPVDVLAMSRMPGERWDLAAATMSDAANDRATRELGAVLARVHAETGAEFGYPGSSTLRATSWPEAVALIVESLLADARRAGVALPDSRIRAAVARGREALAQVTVPRLVHGDPWRGNVFVVPESGRVLGLIDVERAMWADPLFDVVAGDAMNVGDPDPRLAAVPVFSPDERARIELYRIWFTVLMTTEIVPRGFSGDWLVPYRAELAANLATLLERAGA
ncbi:phosphotransferase family protein [Protaetiibacter mangrovi]|uniref:Aminoglycoside phosphotransferase family protein n=1 Tax=Protaetiibacter mangrovi TaxID=2970926 RepID=A0ABT1ZG99_9MICO|nr:aminoglycoside phosphotransferase family protein [Protaetiibacter mangrovi]MCS0499742.1 aminoglycoside phosphotransferase family protein [Protaetiibacter mangrovi]TPW94218.1 aminoglycoside phosphotransferase family protein [Schumannella luteola]